MSRAYTLIVSIALVPCVAVLWQHDAAGTLLAAAVAIVIGAWSPQRPERRIHRAAVRPVQDRSHDRRVHPKGRQTTRPTARPRHNGGPLFCKA